MEHQLTVLQGHVCIYFAMNRLIVSPINHQRSGVSHIEAMCHKDVLLCNVTCDVIKLCALQL